MKENKNSDKSKYTRRQFIHLSAVFAAAVTTRGLAFSSFPAIQNIRQDWHMHTYRKGGKSDAIIADIIKANENYGIELMGISEHIDRIDERSEFMEIVKANRQETSAVQTTMKVMVGTESTMINPNLCAVNEEIVDQLDYVMVSCNHYHLKHVENPNPGTPQAYADHYLDMLYGAAELGCVDTIGHPFYHQKLAKKLGKENLNKILSSYNEEKLIGVLKKAAEVNMAFEINPRHADLALEWFRDLVQESRSHGTKFTLGTDAHSLSALGYPDRSGRTCLNVLNDLNISNKDLKWEPIKDFSVID